jgi:hypothetical protein
MHKCWYMDHELLSDYLYFQIKCPWYLTGSELALSWILFWNGGQIRGSIQKFPDWTPGARTANGIQVFATKCSYVSVLRVSLVSFVTITLRVASQQCSLLLLLLLLLLFISLSTQFGSFWIYPRMYVCMYVCIPDRIAAQDWSLQIRNIILTVYVLQNYN